MNVPRFDLLLHMPLRIGRTGGRQTKCAAGILFLGAGVYQNIELSQERARYEDATTDDQSFYSDQWDKITNARKWRNIFYGIGSGLMAAGAVVFFVF